MGKEFGCNPAGNNVGEIGTRENRFTCGIQNLIVMYGLNDKDDELGDEYTKKPSE